MKGALCTFSCFTSGDDTGGGGCIIWIIDYLLKQMCPAHLICADITHRKAQKGYTEVERAGKII